MGGNTKKRDKKGETCLKSSVGSHSKLIIQDNDANLQIIRLLTAICFVNNTNVSSDKPQQTTTASSRLVLYARTNRDVATVCTLTNYQLSTRIPT